MKRSVLMNPGPVMTDRRVREALAGPDLCHREPEYSELMTRVRQKVVQVAGGDESYTSVLLTGSGTAALEAAVSSVIPRDSKILILDNGHYGDRFHQIARVHQIGQRHLEFGWGTPFDLAAVEQALAEDRSLTHVAMVHHETSTGMLNPVYDVGEIAARHGRSLMVDAISSLAGELLDVRTDHIEWCIGTANKCIEGMPGISFVCGRRSAMEGLANVPPRSFYLDLYGNYVAQEKKRAPAFTPAIQVLYAFEQALDLLIAEGVKERYRRYHMLAVRLRAGLDRLGLRMLLEAEHRCNTLTTIYLPGGVRYPELHDRLKERGFVIYAGQDALQHKAFRLANMGQMTEADIDAFLSALAEVLGIPAGNQAATA